MGCARSAEQAALNPLHCLTAEGLVPGGLYHPVGRIGFLTHWYQRVGALQWPVRVNTRHDDLWRRAEEEIARCLYDR